MCSQCSWTNLRPYLQSCVDCDLGCVNRIGGLAAPAIALGLGSAVSLVGGGAATATAVSGFAASAAGTATITGAFGAIGASHTGMSEQNIS